MIYPEFKIWEGFRAYPASNVTTPRTTSSNQPPYLIPYWHRGFAVVIPLIFKLSDQTFNLDMHASRITFGFKYIGKGNEKTPKTPVQLQLILTRPSSAEPRSSNSVRAEDSRRGQRKGDSFAKMPVKPNQCKYMCLSYPWPRDGLGMALGWPQGGPRMATGRPWDGTRMALFSPTWPYFYRCVEIINKMSNIGKNESYKILKPRLKSL